MKLSQVIKLFGTCFNFTRLNNKKTNLEKHEKLEFTGEGK